MQKLSRRDFLTAAGIVVGGAALVSVPGCSGDKTPAETDSEIETPEFHYGDDQSMKKRILVTYATRTGSTVGVASAIGETLSARGFKVDVVPSKENPQIDGYDAVVMGSAVNGAQWLPEAVEFVQQNRKALGRVPVALFTVHIMNLGDDAESKRKRLAYLDDVRPLVKPVEEVYFAGQGLDPKKASWFERWSYRAFKMGPEGDCRDWNRIRGWAETIL